MPKITKRTVDAMRPETGRDVFTWDTELRGFGVRMKPSGAAAFLIQYRTLQGRTRRHVIGRVGTLTPDQARTEAKARLAEVATKGADPSAERKATREAMTVADLRSEGGDDRSKRQRWRWIVRGLTVTSSRSWVIMQSRV